LLDLTGAMWPELLVILASSDTFVTGHTGSSLLDPAYAVLEKPFHRSNLLSVIRSAIHGLPKPNPAACFFFAAYQTVACRTRFSSRWIGAKTARRVGAGY